MIKEFNFVNVYHPVMETTFTPWLSLLGGALIGLAAVMLMASNGRIAGVSGIVSRLLPPAAGWEGRGEGLAFVGGLLLALPLWWMLADEPPPLALVGAPPSLVIAGLLVGLGSALGNGCTSGHGVCGISRLSIRSIIATCVFMLTAVATVYVLRHVVGA